LSEPTSQYPLSVAGAGQLLDIAERVIVDGLRSVRPTVPGLHELPEELLLRRIHDKNLSAQARAHNKELLSVVRMNIARRNAAETASMK